MRRVVVVVLAALLVLVAAPASATDGSIPKVVSDYINTDLADALNEYYGPGTDGDGTLFEDSTAYSATSRVWEWTPDFEAGIASDTPDRRLNEWVTVVSVREVVLGVATVAIDPQTDAPQLVSYLASPELAAAITGVPATSRLLRDVGREAWLAVEGETVSAVVVGRSGLTEPASVASYRARVALQQPGPQPAVAQPVSLDGVIIVGGAMLLVVALLALLRWRRATRAGPTTEDHAPGVAPTPEDHVL